LLIKRRGKKQPSKKYEKKTFSGVAWVPGWLYSAGRKNDQKY
jgi:hypothetical protein